MKSYLVPIIISAIVIVANFSILPTVMEEQGSSKQRDIPYDEMFPSSKY